MKVSVLARMRRARRGAILSAGGALVTAGVLLVVMTPSLASASIGTCGYGNSSGNLQTCVSVGYNSPTVVGATASVRPVNSARIVNVCLYVNGAQSGCTGYFYAAAGAYSAFTHFWTVGQVPSGTFCAVTWKQQPDGSAVFVDQECVGYYH
jgi:hypothetical protein